MDEDARLLLDEDVPHVLDFLGEGQDEVHCENTIMSTWRYCPYCGESITDAPRINADTHDENGGESGDE